MTTALRSGDLPGGGRERILAAASELFAHHGYHATSIRDVARAVGVTVGALYAHFSGKSEVLVAAYELGVARMIEAVDDAVAEAGAPWDRLEAACRAHLEGLLEASGFARVVIRVLPQDVPEVADDLTALRDRYERRFTAIVAGLDLARHVDPVLFRLALLGALNWSQTWYRPDKADAARIAAQLVETLRHGATSKETRT